MITADEIVNSIGKEALLEMGSNLIEDATKNETVQTIIGGVVLGASLVRVVPFSAPACLAIGLGVAAIQLYRKEMESKAQSEEIAPE